MNFVWIAGNVESPKFLHVDKNFEMSALRILLRWSSGFRGMDLATRLQAPRRTPGILGRL